MKDAAKKITVTLMAITFILLSFLIAPHLHMPTSTVYHLVNHGMTSVYLNDSTYVNIPTLTTININKHSIVYDVRIASKPNHTSAAVDSVYDSLSGMLNDQLTIAHNYGTSWTHVGNMFYANMNHRHVYSSSAKKYVDYTNDALWSFRMTVMNDTLVFVDDVPFKVK